MQLVLTAILLVVAFVETVQLINRFELNRQWFWWKREYGIVYKSCIEEMVRKNIFSRNYLYVTGHNRRYKARLESFTVKLNKFANLTRKEFVASYLGLPKGKTRIITDAIVWNVSSEIPLPDEVDWRKKGIVTRVKDQASCGSCWAFSATGALEGAMSLKKGGLFNLSEQQLVDCSRQYGNFGCNGGFMYYAFNYLKDFGAETEKNYPYRGVDGPCRYNETLSVGNVVGIGTIPTGNETALMHASATVGPISVAIDASALGFMFYRHGIYKSHWCSSKYLDHGVLLVGYGKLKGQPYWLVKNSWGTKWGMDGYIMMAKDYHNMCGIATMADYPIV